MLSVSELKLSLKLNVIYAYGCLHLDLHLGAVHSTQWSNSSTRCFPQGLCKIFFLCVYFFL